MRVLLSHPTSNESSRAAAMGFCRKNMLGAFYTSVAGFPGGFYEKIGSLKFLSLLNRRIFDPELAGYMHEHPVRELARLFSQRAGIKKLTAHEKGIFSVDAIYRNIDKFVGRQLPKAANSGINVLYAYEDGAYYSFQKAGTLDIQRVYDLPIGYWRSMHDLLEQEKQLHPRWANTLVGFKDSAEKLLRKDEELDMADKIIVASSFTANTLKSYTHSDLSRNISIVPYGFPSVKPKHYRNIQPGDKIKLLFVGSLSQRKGLSYLFEALNKMDEYVSLTLVGRRTPYTCPPLDEALKKYTWIETLPHHKILELMQEHDVLVFPSLFEGFGLVITEAMSQGTPVIATERTVGPDIIRHGENGWLIAAGDADALKRIVEEIIHRPYVIEILGKAALKTAEKRPWNVYGKDLAEVVGQIPGA